MNGTRGGIGERHPDDPRVRFPGHRERGPRRGTFTYEDLARATGLTVGTVVAYAAGKRRRFSLDDFASVAVFIREHTPKGERT